MQVTKSRHEMYSAFIHFVEKDIQKERQLVNRRFFSVVLWCFLLPAVATAVFRVGIRFHFLPDRAQAFQDWFVLFFPVVYTIWVFSSEVLSELPNAFRKGGLATTIHQTLKESRWRENVIDGMKKFSDFSNKDWEWILESFEMDLKRLQFRAKFLTAFAGAVLYLIMHGIDAMSDVEPKLAWIKGPAGWIQVSTNDFSQFVGLALFLLLLYLSGNQTHESLQRYLNCVKLVLLDRKEN